MKIFTIVFAALFLMLTGFFLSESDEQIRTQNLYSTMVEKAPAMVGTMDVISMTADNAIIEMTDDADWICKWSVDFNSKNSVVDITEMSDCRKKES